MTSLPPEHNTAANGPVWSGWQLLSFSGLDGQTDWAGGREARLLPDALGVTLEGGEPLTLVVHASDAHWRPLTISHDRICVALADGAAELTLGYASQHLLHGAIEVRPEAQQPLTAWVEVIGEPCETARLLCDRAELTDARQPASLAPGQTARFCLPLGPLAADNDALTRRLPPAAVPAAEPALAKAKAILRGAVMAPEGHLSRPWMLSQRRPPEGAAGARFALTWHAPLLALALAEDEPRLAEGMMLGMLAQQTSAGLLADAVWPDGKTHDSGPPLMCWGCQRLYERTGDREWLAAAAGRLRDVAKYPLAARMLSRLGHARSRGAQFLTWGRGDGAGMDNSPRFDLNEPFAAVDHTALCCGEMASLARIIEEVTPEHREAVHLAWIGEELGRETRDYFWDEQQCFFVDRYPDDEAVDALTIAGWMPLFAGVASDEQAVAMAARHLGPDGDFAAPLPLPSLSTRDPRSDQNRWRGAVFPAATVLVCEGLARYGLVAEAAAVRDRTLTAMTDWYERTGTMWEYYDALDARSPAELPRGRYTGAWPEDAWSAAAYIVLARWQAEGGPA